ncbi:MAG: hypothetical protein H7Y11_05935, partial [Armatimonadetes bacterium]|nr:hypothetical protein [Anaerolineae bacterium]
MYRTPRSFALFSLALLLTLLSASVASAQNSAANWSASFYNNEQLTDPPIFQTSYNELNFDWGDGSPNDAVNKNRWSARFGTDVYFNAGTYRFTINADDGVQLWVDYNLQLTTYNAPRPGETLTMDIPLTAGVHHLQVDYREISGNANLKVAWVNVADIPTTPGTGNWTAQYYSNTSLTGTPFATVSESSPSHQWGLGAPLAGMPADNFSGRWTLTQNFAAGNYGIQVNADDGVRVFVNGVAYINQWALVTGEGYTAGFSLPGGVATIVVEYFEAGFNAFLNFQLFAPQQPPAPPVGSSVATVTTATLNVRNAP